MPLYRRLAHRGFSNYPFKKTIQIVNLGEIEKCYSEGETVDEISLFQKGLIKGRKKGETISAAFPVKILGNGEVTKKLVFTIDAISDSAREKIQKAGGEVPLKPEVPVKETKNAPKKSDAENSVGQKSRDKASKK